jgi:hypothetical protein
VTTCNSPRRAAWYRRADGPARLSKTRSRTFESTTTLSTCGLRKLTPDFANRRVHVAADDALAVAGELRSETVQVLPAQIGSTMTQQQPFQNLALLDLAHLLDATKDLLDPAPASRHGEGSAEV